MSLEVRISFYEKLFLKKSNWKSEKNITSAKEGDCDSIEPIEAVDFNIEKKKD